MKKLILLIGGALVMGACADSPTSPAASRRAPRDRASFDEEFTCRAGYNVAFREDGTPYCVPDPNASQQSSSGTGAPVGTGGTGQPTGRP